ncbi:MAG TPA: hypothetical protein VGM88_31765 [Kofleriaceae bacterium]|jgi:hypothetical protein
MAYRDDIAALHARRTALEDDVRAKTRERDEVAVLLAETERRASLPVLDNVRVAAPCPADWNAMSGDERVRHCGACDKNVYNLSSMTREEAEALIREKNGGLCVRYYRRPDGTILTGDCTVGIRRQRRLLVVVAAGAATLLGVGTAAYELTKPASVHQGSRERLGAGSYERLDAIGGESEPLPPTAPAKP